MNIHIIIHKENEKNSNAVKLVKEMEKNERYGYIENLTSSVSIQFESSKNDTAKY